MSNNTKQPTIEQVQPENAVPTKPAQLEEVSPDDLKKLPEKRHVIIRC